MHSIKKRVAVLVLSILGLGATLGVVSIGGQAVAPQAVPIVHVVAAEKADALVSGTPSVWWCASDGTYHTWWRETQGPYRVFKLLGQLGQLILTGTDPYSGSHLMARNTASRPFYVSSQWWDGSSYNIVATSFVGNGCP